MAADRITVVPNAVGSEWLSGDDDHAAARERLGIDDSLLVGTVSSINGYEGLELIGEVVAELLARGVKARGVVVGDGPALDELRVAPGAEHVTFTGRVNRESAMQWHRAIDVFAVPRLDTSVTRVVTPIKPLEAMATGSLVIASDLPALLETVPDASGGLVVTRDASAWADAIARVLAAGEIAERGAAGRRWVEENRTWEALVDRYDEVYAAARRRLN
ncbi:MAG: glycosyltransferase family 4 protein [Demequina sp.]|nr:glycosyltransferase family 4 protein [Demequina sp.]